MGVCQWVASLSPTFMGIVMCLMQEQRAVVDLATQSGKAGLRRWEKHLRKDDKMKYWYIQVENRGSEEV